MRCRGYLLSTNYDLLGNRNDIFWLCGPYRICANAAPWIRTFLALVVSSKLPHCDAENYPFPDLDRVIDRDNYGDNYYLQIILLSNK